MKKAKIISSILGIVGIFMISIALILQSESTANVNFTTDYKEIDIKNMAASANMVIRDSSDTADNSTKLTEVSMETAPASVIVPPRVEVYEGMTLEELAAKLDRNLGSGHVAGKGYLIASYCLQKGVDPYIAVAIMLHETGCRSNCSYLARVCNNVGGQKGSPGCNGGSYKAYATLDEGIIGFIDNLYKNYYSRGLNTVELIGPRYAESNTWVSKINSYVSSIRNS